MNAEEMIRQIGGEWDGIPFKLLGTELCSQPGIVSLLLSLTHHNDKKIAWRSAYLLDIINDAQPDLVLHHLKQISQVLIQTDNQSILRHFSRILSRHNILLYADGTLIDACFRHLVSKKSAIAVKANMLLIFQKIIEHYPELKHELKEVASLLEQDASPGIKSRLKKINIY